MAPRKRVFAKRQISSRTKAIKTRGFATLADLADEIYLEILSYIPSVPIPAVTKSPSYPEIRRSRHETLLSLSQTSRSLRRFFWRYLWQRIEVREGMKIWNEGDASKNTSYLGSEKGRKKVLKEYNIELVRQLEVVTVRNPQLAQYVNYVDVFIGEYSFENVLAELARCLSLFSNLHTVQIDVTRDSKRPLGKIFTRTFKEYSYPQIRHVSIMILTQSLPASCPEARRISMIQRWVPFRDRNDRSYVEFMADNCPHLEVLEDLPEAGYRILNPCHFVVNSFPSLRIITITPSEQVAFQYDIETLSRLNSLETIVLSWTPPKYPYNWLLSFSQQASLKEEWIEKLKRVLIQIGLRDNLEKTLVIRDPLSGESKISIKPVRTSKGLGPPISNQRIVS